MLRLNVEKLGKIVGNSNDFRTAARIRSASGIVTARVPATTGELCEVRVNNELMSYGEVIAVEEGVAQILLFEDRAGLGSDDLVIALGRRHRIPTGQGLLGRVINGLGEPIDDQGPLRMCRRRYLADASPPAIGRPNIDVPFVTGQRVIDGLLTVGRGQRVGLFAGSGVGKSTLMAEIAKGADVDLSVIAMVGERSREVQPFLDETLGKKGRARSVVIVACSDDAPLMRVRAAEMAVAIAADFRSRGGNVLLMMDSLTRLAMARREIGLLLNEPPSARGYTPSVFQLMSRIVEQLGVDERGSVTGVFTVLVDGDDLDEPISDAARGILDGHIVLDRQLAEAGHFPAVSVSRSISRVFRELARPEHAVVAQTVRNILSTYEQDADLIRIGAYVPGTNPQLDKAVTMLPTVQAFLRQQIGEVSTMKETLKQMRAIYEQWHRHEAAT